MPIRWYEAFWLGAFADLDPTEGNNNTISENASQLVGLTFGGLGWHDQLWRNIVTLGLDDTNNNGTVTEDPPGSAEPLRYTLNGVNYVSPLDSSQAYSATITYGPGTGLAPRTVTVVIAQDNLGNLFLVPPIANDATAAALVAGPIAQIRIVSLVTANSSGLNVNRQNLNLLCFAAGTLIDTARGPVPVEDLVPGDRLVTRDRGLRPLRAVLAREVVAEGALAPVEIGAGVLGNDAPLRLSPQHRVLVAGHWAELLHGTAEVLVPAVALVDGRRVVRRVGGRVRYFHLVLDRHELLRSGGVWTESLHVTAQSLGALAKAQQDEIAAIFPQLPSDEAVRPCLRVNEARPLVRAILPALLPA